MLLLLQPLAYYFCFFGELQGLQVLSPGQVPARVLGRYPKTGVASLALHLLPIPTVDEI
jgi:hypothetical protein